VNDLDAERARAVAGELAASGVRSTAAPFDVGDHEQVAAGVASIAADLGSVDILVNNAGIPTEMGLVAFRDETPDRWMAFLAVNALGPMNCTRAVLEHMRAQHWGRIITIASAAYRGAAIGVSIYGASKGAGVSFTRNIALEEAASGITANSIALGVILTDAAMAELEPMLAATVPVGRMGRPDEVAALCVYLASDEAAYTTGQTIGLDGGVFTT